MKNKYDRVWVDGSYVGAGYWRIVDPEGEDIGTVRGDDTSMELVYLLNGMANGPE